MTIAGDFICRSPPGPAPEHQPGWVKPLGDGVGLGAVLLGLGGVGSGVVGGGVGLGAAELGGAGGGGTKVSVGPAGLLLMAVADGAV